MFNIVTILPVIRAAMPALVIVAGAFKYGLQRHGGETWKDKSPMHHAMKAKISLSEWLVEPSKYSRLADAALRLLFALCLVATEPSYVPKAEATEEK